MKVFSKTPFLGHFWHYLCHKIRAKSPSKLKICGFMRIGILYDTSRRISPKGFDKYRFFPKNSIFLGLFSVPSPLEIALAKKYEFFVKNRHRHVVEHPLKYK